MSWYFFIGVRLPSRAGARGSSSIVSRARGRPARGAAEGGDEDSGAAGRVRGEEFDDLVVVERQPGGAEAEGIGRQVCSPTAEAGGEVHETIAAVAIHTQHRGERREIVENGGGVTAQRLLETE